MSIEFEWHPGLHLLEVRASGTLTKVDYDRFVPEVEKGIEEQGRLRILFEMTEFHGWRPGAAWEDLKFGVRHMGQIERMAMVGDRSWEKLLAVFARVFTAAPVRYFDRAEIEEARAWVAADQGPSLPLDPT